MNKKHPHTAAINRLGVERVRSHFNLSLRALQNWKEFGIPAIHQNSVRLLAMLCGVPVPEVDVPAERQK